jgi:hypothetical protein
MTDVFMSASGRLQTEELIAMKGADRNTKLLVVLSLIKETFTLEQATKAQRGSRSIALLFL